MEEDLLDILIKESNKILNETARIDTSIFETVNDSFPQGVNTWMFSIDKFPSSPSDYAKFEKDGTIVYYDGKYNDALKEVQKDFPKAKIIYVLP